MKMKPRTMTAISTAALVATAATLVVVTRPPQPTAPGTAQADAITIDGVTWTFEDAEQVGQFVTGDWFVVDDGDVIVVSVSPSFSGGQNGSQLNPRPIDKQGYDTRAARYDSALTVSFPVNLSPHDMLVSAISGDAPYVRLDAVEVLACVAARPAGPTYRPGYCDGGVGRYHTQADVDLSFLPAVAPPTSAPGVAHSIGEINGVWLDHQPYWDGKLLHPDDDMPSYGKEIARVINDAALVLCLGVPQRDLLADQMIQRGLDWASVVRYGGEYTADGGHGSGRAFPVLFAGAALGDPELIALVAESPAWQFGEHCQTYYLPDGTPEWGIRHCYRPDQDNPAWTAPYRQCCTANAWAGAVLAARLMDIDDDWNRPAMFDYQDRYMGIEQSLSAFAQDMWEAHR